jgi:hypothetical protein
LQDSDQATFPGAYKVIRMRHAVQSRVIGIFDIPGSWYAGAGSEQVKKIFP